MDWSEIEALDMVRTGRKVFLILQGGQSRPVLITNTIQPFEEFLKKLTEKLAEEKVSGAGEGIGERAAIQVRSNGAGMDSLLGPSWNNSGKIAGIRLDCLITE